VKISKGVQYILIASVFFSIINALVKYFDRIPAIEIVFFRSIVSLVLSYKTIHSLKIKIINKDTPLLLCRGISGAIALSLYFYTIQHIPLATAVTILYLAPIFTIILAIFMVKEYPNRKQWPFLIMCFIGAALMKNIDSRVSIKHFAMGIAAAFFAGLAYNFIRLLKDKAHHSLVIFYFPLVTIPFCLPWLIPNWITPKLDELIGLLSIGVLTQFAQVFMTKAYMQEKASKIGHFNYLTSFYAFATGIIFFDEHLNLISISGLIIMFVGIIFSSKFSNKS
jgi:drug/metabolite transporter (DMT)-like permease